jgi:hypothetical protein
MALGRVLYAHALRLALADAVPPVDTCRPATMPPAPFVLARGQLPM